MLKKIFAYSFLFVFVFSFSTSAEELNLTKDKLYVLFLNDEIVNFQADTQNLDAQILHTIFDDRKQLLLSLKNNTNSFLQIKTNKELLKYEIKNSQTSSKNLVEIDTPSIENLNVDIYEGN